MVKRLNRLSGTILTPFMLTLVSWFPFLSHTISGMSATAVMVEVLPSWPVTPCPPSVSLVFTHPSLVLVLSTLAPVSAIQMFGSCSTLIEFGISLFCNISDTSASLLLMDVSSFSFFAFLLAIRSLYQSGTFPAFFGSLKQFSALCLFCPQVLHFPLNFSLLASSLPLESPLPSDLH